MAKVMVNQKSDYPENWKKIAEKLKEEANWTCQECGIKHNEEFKDGKKAVLGVAHLDQNRQHNKKKNLKVLCQRCHFKFDQQFNVMRRKYGKKFNLKPQLSIWD